MEHIELVCSLDSKLLFILIYSIRNINILKVIAKTSVLKSGKMLNPGPRVVMQMLETQ